ncbi:MAG TPA: S4 domain-containing protein, partial [Puia sp.]|nr:S4 domain-containing protein [Puia sp.]
MKRKTDNFDKFFNKKRNSAIKEQFKQEKKAAKKERKEAIERHFEAKRQARAQQFQGDKPGPAPAAGYKGTPADAHLKKLPGKKKPPPLATKTSGHEQAHTDKAGTPTGTRASHAPAFGGGDANLIPLNKYIAHSGICSRRDAAELIRQGKVQVNNQLITEPGTKVAPEDFVKVNGKKVTISRNFVYILLNKPKDYITTAEDPQGRKTVLDLTRHATTERVYP